MNVSKINIINSNKSGASLFRGEAPFSDKNRKETQKKSDATKFLYGAGIVSAGILAAACAGRAGLFSKSLKAASKEASDVVKSKKVPAELVDKRIPTPAEEKIIPMDLPREERMKPRRINPDDYKYSISYSKYDDSAIDVEKAAYFTNIMTRIQRMSYENQFHEFKGYLNFIKTLDAESLNRSILFTLGSFKRDNNIRFAKEALNFAKENPAYKNVILSNLVSYSPDWNFSRELSDSKFARTENLAKRYDRHIENIITIRKLMTESGLKCDEHAKLKNRQDWIDIGGYGGNRYMLGFQYSERLPEVRKAAFEYDIMNGLSKKEAENLIKQLKASDSVIVHKSVEELAEDLKKSGIPAERAKSLVTQLSEETAQLRKKHSEYFEEFQRDSRIPEEKLNAYEEKVKALYSKDALPESYKELAKYGISRKSAEMIVNQLNSKHKLSKTQQNYGMTLDEMIKKIANAILPAKS